MKLYGLHPKFVIFLLGGLWSIFLISCSDSDEIAPIATQQISQADKEALLFMFEEEKLARDTYLFLGEKWALNQFLTIKNSEQSHMDAVANLLVKYGVDYTALPVGDFYNSDLQSLYNELISDGASDVSAALIVGATIEDLDIVDLQNHIVQTGNSDIVSVFESLQCGSRNHLRSFVSSLENIGGTYSPQYLDITTYENILESTHEKCNQQPN
ncbi:DUF2202 domain-containing protein [Pareuzebyella sediminis]|uniref:DUF2202 domain-containing protein n=1 Tax=Pareuzebyella sediminis TaxID=2607998 RepID=UPI0011ED6D11|nr:DUF2202 domain-containing protein [Pareuzebyella sediminis]